MKAARILALAGLAIMTGAIAGGFLYGDFFSEGSAILAMAWGKVTMIDLYIGFLIFWAWIAYRENRPGKAALWLVLMLGLGSWAACLYLVLAFSSSHGDPDVFFRGARRASEESGNR